MEHVTTVLIADSADDFCTALTAALQHADGFQVVGTASDGEQAIRMVEERKPDPSPWRPPSSCRSTCPRRRPIWGCGI